MITDLTEFLKKAHTIVCLLTSDRNMRMGTSICLAALGMCKGIFPIPDVTGYNFIEMLGTLSALAFADYLCWLKNLIEILEKSVAPRFISYILGRQHSPAGGAAVDSNEDDYS